MPMLATTDLRKETIFIFLVINISIWNYNNFLFWFEKKDAEGSKLEGNRGEARTSVRCIYSVQNVIQRTIFTINKINNLLH